MRELTEGQKTAYESLIVTGPWRINDIPHKVRRSIKGVVRAGFATWMDVGGERLLMTYPQWHLRRKR